MRDSLLHHFQGAFLGAAIGDWLGAVSETALPSQSVWTLAVNPHSRLDLGADATVRWGKVAIALSQRLIQYSPPVLAPGTVDPSIVRQASYPLYGLGLGLPLALFFHDDRERLQQELQSAIASLTPVGAGSPWELSDGRVAIEIAAETTALLFTLDRPERILIPQVIERLHLRDRHPIWAEHLTSLEVALEQRSSLTHVAQHLLSPLGETNPVIPALIAALYGCLSTLRLPSVALYRSLRLHSASSTTQHPRAIDYGRLTGAMAGSWLGVYHAKPKLPLRWQQMLQPSLMPMPMQPWFALTWGVDSGDSLSQVAGQLFAVWAGALEPDDFLRAVNRNTAIAALQTLRLR